MLAIDSGGMQRWRNALKRFFIRVPNHLKTSEKHYEIKSYSLDKQRNIEKILRSFS